MLKRETLEQLSKMHQNGDIVVFEPSDNEISFSFAKDEEAEKLVQLEYGNLDNFEDNLRAICKQLLDGAIQYAINHSNDNSNP